MREQGLNNAFDAAGVKEFAGRRPVRLTPTRASL